VALEPVSVTVEEAKDLVLVDLPLPGAGDRDAEQDAVRALREDVVPQTVGAVDGVQVAVAGSHGLLDGLHDRRDAARPVGRGVRPDPGVRAALASFRSVVVAVKAIVLNLLSVAAAYGVIVASFQWGWGEALLGFESNGVVAAWLPLFLFVILFGLSMDYHVFILSRVRELRTAARAPPRRSARASPPRPVSSAAPRSSWSPSSRSSRRCRRSR
jgi:RND superfamily putative drug exporter